MTQQAAFWDKIAPKYAKDKIADETSYEFTLERTRSYLRDSDHALEFGCGTGSTAVLLAPSVAQITASDISAKMLEIGAERAKEAGVSNIDFHHGEVADPALKAGGYDVVLAHNVLHLIRDREAAIAAAHRLLKPGGMFISKTICYGNGAWYLPAMMLVVPIMRLFGKAPYVKISSIRHLDQMVTDAGFEIVETGNYPAKPARRYIVARKV